VDLQNETKLHRRPNIADMAHQAPPGLGNILPQGNNLRAVSLVNTSVGTVVADFGTILRITDGGSIWAVQSSGTKETLRAISLTDSNNGTVIGETGTILRTTDSGANWLPQTSGTSMNLWAVHSLTLTTVQLSAKEASFQDHRWWKQFSRQRLEAPGRR
jgi:photosystem II stability/assembly factor-like uncharacterized protein